MSDGEVPSGGATSRIGAARLAIGLLQGLALYGLHRASDLKAWPATAGPLFAALVLAGAFTPPILLAGLGELRRATLILWTLAAAAFAAALAAHGVASGLPDPVRILPNPPVILFTAAALFIAHHLIVPADKERRLWASYPSRFDVAWLSGAQLGLAIAFTGAFWILLVLGAVLFNLIGIKGFATFIAHDWFYFPVTGLVFAAAVHLADIRVGLTRGLRTVGLTLLSWLLPVMMLIAVAFLIALPFTGLGPLWRAGAATGVLLASIAALIVLINAAYQDGAQELPAPVVLRWAARITALALIPLTGVAAWGLGLRIGEHGLTPQRIIAAACVAVAASYALGYAYAAVRPGRWMRRLEATNVFAAVIILALILAFFTPIADPSRIAVADQVGRLERGEVTPAKFDFEFLRFNSGRYGLAALKRLTTFGTGPNAALIAQRAAVVLKQKYAYEAFAAPQVPLARITVYPVGSALPADFPRVLPDVNCGEAPATCEAYLVDLRGDASTQVLVRQGAILLAYAKPPGADAWSVVGQFNNAVCPQALAALRSGAARRAPPQWSDLIAGERRLVFQPPWESSSCADQITANPRAAPAQKR